MLFALPVIAACLAILYLATLGSVLLWRFVLGAEHRGRRVLAAILTAPTILILPIFAMAALDDTSRTLSEWAIAFIILLAVGAMLCWPVAHFATRRLDWLTAFDPAVFE